MILEYLFWVCAFLILYTYALYPVVLAVIALMKSARTDFKAGYGSRVSLIISLYNEQGVIEEKLKNLSSLDYPRDKMDVLFGSDGSTDKTNEILQAHASANIQPHLFPTRRGKATVLNELVPCARGEIVVFSDANTFFHPQTIRKLVEPFADPTVGAVCGELQLRSDSSTTGGLGESSYWTYENGIKHLESECKTLIGATGGVYAIRKELFEPLPGGKSIMDDFLIPIQIVKKGYNVKYEPEALAFEQPSDSVGGEFRRKVRISASNFNGISEYASLLHPRWGFVSFALWSHKMIRWFVPFLLLAAFGTSLWLASASSFYRLVLAAELGFCSLALIGFAAEKLKMKIGILGIPYYFMAVNLALLVGFFKFLFGTQRPTWDVIR